MNLWLPMRTIWWREVVRFCRQRDRIIGAFGTPLVFWVLIGTGLGGSFRPAAGSMQTGYLEYFFPGAMILILLFTAIFSTISIIEDRREGFLQSILVAPIPRSSFVLGKILGGTTLALIQGAIFLAMAPLMNISMTPWSVLAALGTMFLVAFGLTGLGFMIAWRMDSTQGFHAIMNLFLMPMWFLSGAFFPATGVPPWLEWVMKLNPLTYGVSALRQSLYLAHPSTTTDWPPLNLSVIILVLFCLMTWAGSAASMRRRTA